MKAYNLTDNQIKNVIAETSARLYKDAFLSRSAITGEEILEFCSHKQINKFILFQIYQEWNLYSSKLNHPYFDFQDQEVRGALQQFQNVLSQHIRVERKDFKALLDKATYNSVKLVLNPLETFGNFFFLNKDSLSIAYFERYAHYFSDFDFVVNSILQRHQKAGANEVLKADFFELTDRIVRLYEQKSGHLIDHYRSIIFHKLTGQEIGKLLEQSGSSVKPNISRQKNETESKTEAQPQPEHKQYLAEAESLVQGLYNRSEAEAATEPNEDAENNRNYEGSVAVPETKAAQPEPDPSPPAKEPEVSEPEPSSAAEKPATLAERFARSKQTSANPSREFGAKETSGEIKIEQIPMHKQFQFVQKVFAGDRDKFKQTIGALNQCEDWTAAEEYLRTHILNMPEVKRDDEVTQEFVAFIKAKK